MRPKEVTDLLGIDRERIKYFKKQDVFHPDNPALKGGADYTEHDVEELRKLVVLNKAGLTCGDIKKIQTGEWTLQTALEERRKLIFDEMERMKGSLHLSEEMLNDGTDFGTMSANYYWNVIQRREEDGEKFMEEVIEDTSPISLIRTIQCPHCHETQEVDLEEYVWDETCNESMRDDDMGADIVYSFDSDCAYECQCCGKVIRITGWVREYPIGGYDSEKITAEKFEEEEE